MPKATLVYVIDEKTKKVLLAKKRRKIGIGKWFGYGGKFEPEDLGDPIACLTREVLKETNNVIDLSIFDIELVGVIRFYNGFWKIPGISKPFTVLCYRAIGTVTKIPPTTEEMETPNLFDFFDLPLHEFKKGDERFVPQLFCGIPTTGWIWFTKNEKKVLGSRIVSCSKEKLQRLAQK